MSNFKIERDQQIQDLLPQFIQHLTHLPPNDTRYQRCLDLATMKIRNQSELAINGHEVQRRVEAVCEKFTVSNYQFYGDKLRLWKDQICSHPLVVDSEQVDVHWAVLQLIMDIAQRPVDAMTDRIIENKGKLIEYPEAVDADEGTGQHEALIDSLLHTNLVEKEHPRSDELSDWSDSESSDIGADKSEASLVVETHRVSQRPPLNIKPPERQAHYTVLEEASSQSWLQDTIQNSWWSAKESRTAANSAFCSANFAQEWNNYLDSLSLGYISDKNLSTTSEYILMRELIWMFIAPSKQCKFFRMVENSVQLNKTVTTTSCSLPIIQSFLSTITGSMSNLLELRQFVSHVRDSANSAPVALEIYAGCLMEHINSLENYVLDIETKLMDQNDCMTSLTFIGTLQEKHLKIIDALHKIHSTAICEWQIKPNYVSSAFLLSQLWEYLEYPIHPLENNLAASLLVPCLQSFLAVFDSWWTLGRLDDYVDEFPLEEWGAAREYPVDCKKFIEECPLIKYLIGQCKESNVIMTHLFSMSRVNILNDVNRDRPSYQEFLSDFLKPFKIPPKVTEETQTESPIPTNEYYCELMELLLLEDQIKSENTKEHNAIMSPLDIFEVFQSSRTNFQLPFLDLVLKSLAAVLEPRIVAAHSRIAKIFLDEFKIVNHFRNVHWVLLLESPAMYDFYTDLFVAIEADYNNLSSYQLTAKLETCLSAVHPQMESLFTVEFDRHYFKTELDTILDCLPKLKIDYNFQAAEGVIEVNKTSIYNRTFSFLLQIKWALWLLENLQFSSNWARVKFFKEPNVLDFSIRQMGILRYWLLTSIKNIHSYLMNQVVEFETVNLENNLKKCTSLAKIQRCHERFLGIIETKCFLAEEQRELQGVLQEFLHFILIFRDYWHQLQDISERDYQLEQQESKNALLDIKISQLEETYSNIHHCLADKLKLEVDGTKEGHLADLLGAFLFKQPTIHSNKI